MEEALATGNEEVQKVGRGITGCWGVSWGEQACFVCSSKVQQA